MQRTGTPVLQDGEHVSKPSSFQKLHSAFRRSCSCSVRSLMCGGSTDTQVP